MIPLAERRHTRGMPTFEEAAAKVLALHRPGWRNAKHAAQWATTLQEYAHPHLGSLPRVRGDHGRRADGTHRDLG